MRKLLYLDSFINYRPTDKHKGFIFADAFFANANYVLPCDDNYWDTEKIKEQWEKSCVFRKTFFGSVVNTTDLDKPLENECIKYLNELKKFENKVIKKELSPLERITLETHTNCFFIDKNNKQIIVIDPNIYWSVMDTFIDFMEDIGGFDETTKIKNYFCSENQILYIFLSYKYPDSDKEHYCFIAGIKRCEIDKKFIEAILTVVKQMNTALEENEFKY